MKFILSTEWTKAYYADEDSKKGGGDIDSVSQWTHRIIGNFVSNIDNHIGIF